ncbi:MAG: universal stress protein [Mycetocola sp.]
MRYIIGYTDTPAGKDALALGIRLARSRGGRLDIVIVLDTESRPATDPSDRGYDRLLERTARGWLADATAAVPEGLTAHPHIVYAESHPEGLLEAAERLDAAMIVVGAARGGLLGRLSIGSVAGGLLHTATIPVAIAPEGERHQAHQHDVSRITAMIGTRPGSEQLLDEAIIVAEGRGVPLRLVSLVALDYPSDSARPAADERAAAHADEVLAYARDRVDSRVTVTTETAHGDGIEVAARRLQVDPDELVLFGSSRLATSGRIFLGSTAARVLRELTVPMIVVPKDYSWASSERSGR